MTATSLLRLKPPLGSDELPAHVSEAIRTNNCTTCLQNAPLGRRERGLYYCEELFTHYTSRLHTLKFLKPNYRRSGSRPCHTVPLSRIPTKLI